MSLDYRLQPTCPDHREAQGSAAEGFIDIVGAQTEFLFHL